MCAASTTRPRSPCRPASLLSTSPIRPIQTGTYCPSTSDTRSTNAQQIPTTSHEWDTQHSAWNGGKNDNWLPAHRAADAGNAPFVMGYYTREDLPFHYALADAFTVCDNYYCSVLGPTWSNRLYWQTATIDPAGEYGGPVTYNGHPDGKLYRWTTYAERLQAAGVTWRDYHYGTGLVAHGMLPQFQTTAPAGTDGEYVAGLPIGAGFRVPCIVISP